MNYISTRGYETSFTASEAILQGLAPDGGLFVPETIPVLSERDWQRLVSMTYQQRAVAILSLYLDFSESDLADAVAEAYSETKFGESPAPLTQLNKYSDLYWMLELWHGPTSAFKDLALQLLPHLMRLAARKTGSDAKYCILTATSGDTGKAALEGFRDVPGTEVVVFYPTDGVSNMQKLQMQTQRGSNCHVYAVRGSFDDAQTEVKQIFGDPSFADQLHEHNIVLSSANSINWGRLVPQIVYYCSLYCDFLAKEKLASNERFDIVVPSGNFGNILAAWYAGQMGVPIDTLFCASNKNHVLTDFLRDGTYNRKRTFYKTNTPSMDILVSSNLERLLFELTNHDSWKVAKWQEELRTDGRYQVDRQTLHAIQRTFKAGYADENVVIRTIRDVYHEYDHVIDTHTAVGFAVHAKATNNTKPQDLRKTVYVATASPFKFPHAVAEAIFGRNQYAHATDRELLDAISQESGLPIPQGLAEVFDLPILQKEVINPGELEHAVERSLGLHGGSSADADGEVTVGDEVDAEVEVGASAGDEVEVDVEVEVDAPVGINDAEE